jgi:glycosyltransferase involved in cell wall biosynthesis
MQLHLRRGQYDIVQCYGLRAELLARGAAHGMGIKVVSSICSIDPWRKWYHVALDRLTMDAVTAWISTSNAAAEVKIARERVPREKIFIIPTGIPDRPIADAEARNRARKKLKLTENDAPVLAVIANIRPAKGYGDLIDAVAKLKEQWPGIVCLCAGRDDSDGAIPRLAAARGLENNMRFLGFRSDAPIVYDAADLAVLPSHWEGMPLSLLEALRAGLPCVATRVGGVAEVIDHGAQGLLCPPRDPAALIDSISKLLEDDALRGRMAAGAREKFENDFRVELMVEKMTEVYERMLGRR